MRSRSLFSSLLVLALSVALVIPPDVVAQAQAGQPAGQISRLIPAVDVQRGTKKMKAAVQFPVQWEDIVATERQGRARISLNDGSVLNVGSESSLKVARHDAGTQQTEVDLTYGRLRSQAVKIARPGGKFEVRTPVGVAGVVGSNFFLSYLNGILQLIVYEGIIQFCNLQNQCVSVGSGQTSSITQNSGPTAPLAATPSQLMEAGESTEVADLSALRGAGQGAGGKWPWIVTIAVVVATAVAVPIAVTRGGSSQRSPGCSPNDPRCG